MHYCIIVLLQYCITASLHYCIIVLVYLNNIVTGIWSIWQLFTYAELTPNLRRTYARLVARIRTLVGNTASIWWRVVTTDQYCGGLSVRDHVWQLPDQLSRLHVQTDLSQLHVQTDLSRLHVQTDLSRLHVQTDLSRLHVQTRLSRRSVQTYLFTYARTYAGTYANLRRTYAALCSPVFARATAKTFLRTQ